MLGYEGSLKAAISEYEAAIGVFQELQYELGIADVLFSSASILLDLGDPLAALEHTHKALDTYRRHEKPLEAGAAVQNIGRYLVYCGEHTEGLRYLREAEDVFRSLGDERNLCQALHNIGHLYGGLGDLESAELYYNGSIDLAINNDISVLVGVNYIHLTRFRLEAGLLDEAYLSIVQALRIAEELNTSRLLVPVYLWAARVEARRGNVDEADAYLQRLPKNVDLSARNRGTGMVVHAEVLRLQGQLDKAKALCTEALELFGDEDSGLNVEYALKCLLQIAKEQGDMAAYVQWHEEQQRVQQLHYQTESANRVAAQEKQREVEATRKEFDKHLAVLHSALPKHIADRVARGETVNDHYDNATVIFLDIVGFTTISDRIPSGHVVHLLEQIFTTLDAVCEKHNVVKIKTIGDS